MASGGVGQFRLAPGESFVQCPYHPAHIVTNSRLITHLDKCRNNYVKEQKAKGKPVEMVACRFNYTHKIPKPEQIHHENNCQEAITIIPSLYTPANIKPVTQVNRCIPDDSVADDEEDWDRDAASSDSTAGYDPRHKIESECLLYMPRGLTKSQRKEYRLNNRKKWIEGESADRKPAVATSSSASANVVVKREHQASPVQPLPPSAASNATSDSYDWEEE